MARPAIRVLVVGLAIVGGLSLVLPVAAHGNHLAADAQVTGDGAVRIEGVRMVSTGWVVIHSVGPGETGDVVGHASPDRNVFETGFTVPVNASYWHSGTGNRTLWAVLHHDADGDGEFDASSDPPIGGRDAPDHAVRLDVRPGDRSAFVLAERERAQRTNASRVVVRRAHLPAAGYLVVRENADGSPGDVVGHRFLGAGGHEAVGVNLSAEFYRHRPEEFTLWAAVYGSDGDGRFDDGDRPVSVGGSMVASEFRVNRTDAVVTDHPHTPSPTETQSEDHSPSTHDDDHDHEQQASTPSTPAAPSPTAGANGPGLGIPTAIGALLVALGLGRSVRR